MRAKDSFGDAIKKWPNAGEFYSALARIFYEHREQLPQARRLIRHALQHQSLTADLMMLAVTLHEKCDDKPERTNCFAPPSSASHRIALKLRARKVNLEGLDALLESIKKPAKTDSSNCRLMGQ